MFSALLFGVAAYSALAVIHKSLGMTTLTKYPTHHRRLARSVAASAYLCSFALIAAILTA